jgi:CheY-like chemotaxis protein
MDHPSDDELSGTKSATLSGLHILIVEDNADCAESTAMLLHAYGHTAESAKDGEAALQAVERRCPDVVLLDITLPDMNGWDLAKRLRQQANGAEPLLIAITGWAREEDRQHSMESGIDLHLAKPVEPEQLHALLTNVEKARDSGPPAEPDFVLRDQAQRPD